MIYLPLLWLIFFFNYIINIDGLLNDGAFEESNRRFGFFRYEPPFVHLLFQLFMLFYACFTLYLFRDEEQVLAQIEEIKMKRERRKLAKAERLNSEISLKQSTASMMYTDSFIIQPGDNMYTYQILFRYLLKNIDIFSMVILYLGGVDTIDVYHAILLILFAVFIIYPMQFRRNFVFVLYFMIFIAIAKYLYVLFLPEIENRQTLQDVLNVLGLSTNIQEDRKYGRSNLFTFNYLIVFTGFLQYRLYTSDYSKSAFTDEQAEKDIKTFGSRFPKLTMWITVLSELVQMAIPWITYIVFLSIAIVNNKSLINWVLLTITLLLLFWHITADLITVNSHIRLTRGWTVFTLVSAICFLAIVIFQILSKDQISQTNTAQKFIDSVPDFIRDNMSIIGFNDYTDFTLWERAVKFLAYVAYFNLSIITRRQFAKSCNNVKEYITPIGDEPVDFENETEENKKTQEEKKEEVIEARFSLVFIVYKLKKVWPVIDTISWHVFTVLAIICVMLAFHWKLSVATAVYVTTILVYYVLLPFVLQPDERKSGLNESQTITYMDMKFLWGAEDENAKFRTLWLKSKVITLLSFFTVG